MHYRSEALTRSVGSIRCYESVYEDLVPLQHRVGLAKRGNRPDHPEREGRPQSGATLSPRGNRLPARGKLIVHDDYIPFVCHSFSFHCLQWE